MKKPLKFLALTSSSIGTGTILEYLHRTTDIHVGKIYFDTLQEKKRRPVTGPLPPAAARDSFWKRLRYHSSLAPRMPRRYAFRLIERAFGLSELQVLLALDRLHPGLMRLAAGISLPAEVPKGRLLYSLREVARVRSIPIVETPSLNNPETVRALREEQADIFLGFGTRILSAPLLEAARIGVLNAHSSLLPEYRGGTTEFWQLATGETRTGVTVHWMAPRVDEGAICAQTSWPIPRGANHHHLRLLSLFLRLEVWREVIAQLLRGEVPRILQGTPRTPTFKHPSLEELYQHYRLGLKLPR